MLRRIIKSLAYLRGWEWYARTIGVQVGDGCRIYDVMFGTEPFLIAIGDRVTVAAGVRFVTHDGALSLVKDEEGRRYKFNRIVVEDDSFIGANSIIMPGVRIGSSCIVAAGSVVTKSLPSRSVVGGNPAKWIMSYDEYRMKNLGVCVSKQGWKRTGDYREDVLSVLDESYKLELKK